MTRIRFASRPLNLEMSHLRIFEGRFTVEQKAPLSPAEAQSILLGKVMMVLLERGRG
jgi:hypothetical protein